MSYFGHARLFYQDKNGEWRCTEFTGKKPSSAIVYDYEINMDTNELFNFLNNYNCKFFYIPGDYSKVKKFANMYKETNYGGYKLFTNNCLRYVVDALNYAGVNKYRYTINPSWFDSNSYISYGGVNCGNSNNGNSFILLDSERINVFGLSGGGLGGALCFCNLVDGSLISLMGRYMI